MVLIIGRNNDQDIVEISEFLSISDLDYIVIDPDVDTVELNFCNIEMSQIEIKINCLKTLELTICSFILFKKNKLLSRHHLISSEWKDYLTKEIDLIEDTIIELISRLKNVRVLSGTGRSINNKILLLSKANAFDISVPKTYFVSNSDQLRSMTMNYSLMTKSLHIPEQNEDRVNWTPFYTKVIDCNIDNLNTNFIASLVQIRIEKKIEIRSVYLEGIIYSCFYVIDKNVDDIRQTNYNLPYFKAELKENIKEKLIKYFTSIKVNFCSFDSILDVEDNFYLIDINPYGQFSLVNQLYNNKILKHLIKIFSTDEK